MGNNLEARMAANNTPATQKQPSLANQIQSMEKQFALAMPKGMEAQQLVRDALTCLRQTPDLALCTPASVLGSLMTCAQLGLRPGVLGHAYLLPFYDKRAGGKVAQLVVGYQGWWSLHTEAGKSNPLSHARCTKTTNLKSITDLRTNSYTSHSWEAIKVTPSPTTR